MQQHITSRSRLSAAEKIRSDARRFIDGLADRLVELDRMSQKAKRYNVFSPKEYAEFKSLFVSFTDRTEEFQMLSYLAEESLSNYERGGADQWREHQQLDEYFRKLQIPMLRQVISTNLRLLKIWDDRLQRGEGLPYGARELFLETIRVIYNAKTQLLRPRYVALLDNSALHDADRAERLLRTLIRKAPKLFDFAEDDPGLRIADAVPEDEDDDDIFADDPPQPEDPDPLIGDDADEDEDAPAKPSAS
ncbi:MAG TPA: hypothetical protein VM661_09010 [Candidatus Sulfotelmatobacter sp.]|nr:hypothetical protein [Candidatus Sulfotelmatobacter sp.]